MPTGWGESGWGEDYWGVGGDDDGIPPIPLVPAARLGSLQLEIEELGIDIDVIDDLPPTFALAKGRKNLANAILRRLVTPAGALALGFDGDPDYGRDVRGRLNAAWTLDELSQLESQVEDECRKDERVESATATVAYTLATSTLDIDIQIETRAGPFRLILAVSAVTAEVLRIE